MNLNPVMERFYVSVLDYAGLEVNDEHNIVNKDPDFGDFTLDDKPLALPYFELMKNPEGRRFFHLLHENYSSPETTLFNLFNRRLTLEINLRLQTLVTTLIAVASEPTLQQRIKSTELVNIISSMGTMDHSVIEPIFKMCVNSKKENDVGYLVDFYLKKNGKVGDTHYSAIGKVNHRLYREVKKSLEAGPEGEYRVYGTKFRKKDLVALEAAMDAIFPNIDDEEAQMDGTDNKIFRYLNILLKTSYIVSARLNDIADLLEEVGDESLGLDKIKANLDWVNTLEDLYGMADTIRLIPNQTDIRIESKKLKVNETKAKEQVAEQPQPTQQPVQQPPQFNPGMVQQPQPVQQQVQQPQQQELSPEDIIRGRVNQQFQQPMMQPQMYQQPMMQPQPQLPSWAQRELMQQQQQVNPQVYQQQFQQPMMQQQGFVQPMMQQGYQQPMMAPQYQQHPQTMQGQWGQPQMQLNPHMMQRATAPM